MKKSIPLIIFQNDPVEKHIPLKAHVEKVILTGRIWRSIFKDYGYEPKAGDSVRWGDRNFKVESITPNHGSMANLTISRVFDGSKHEKVPIHKEATAIYIAENNPKLEEIEVEKDVPTHVLYMHQEGGCDYTIGCGNKAAYIHAKGERSAVLQARAIIRDYGKEEISEAILIKISSIKELV